VGLQTLPRSWDVLTPCTVRSRARQPAHGSFGPAATSRQRDQELGELQGTEPDSVAKAQDAGFGTGTA